MYLKSDQMPHREEDAVDPKSRHKGKLDTEDLLRRSGMVQRFGDSSPQGLCDLYEQLLWGLAS